MRLMKALWLPSLSLGSRTAGAASCHDVRTPKQPMERFSKLWINEASSQEPCEQAMPAPSPPALVWPYMTATLADVLTTTWLLNSWPAECMRLKCWLFQTATVRDYLLCIKSWHTFHQHKVQEFAPVLDEDTLRGSSWGKGGKAHTLTHS